ncbi:serine/threonine-protein kinase [Pseudofrankia sp. BMG5.36]|uniref:serine/threonine-protein kinase n=1 Tax=Pseudofrankia sp. BMG5.36 TaxID=1834512 RepID=UPI000A54A14C|nr:serine/threonine-protein kinase [Pseudofrankia sp. BMG5.36]
MLGRHRLVGRLGSGGMGVVYQAEGPRGRVALKMIRAELVDDPDYRVRFQREIQACFRVESAHTARLVDFELDSDRPWLATEFIDATDLERWVRTHGPLPDAAQRTLAAGLAEALAAIHAVGLVHRDLKPSNVLWTADGPQVIDFGIAAAADARPLTATGQFIGTPAWFSPEQAAGGEATTATDVFGWGALVCFAASGRPPFGGGRAEVVLDRVRSAEPDVDYDQVAAPLRALVRRALAREPASRPTAEALRDELADLVGGAVALTAPHDGPTTEVTRVLPPDLMVPGGSTPPPAWPRSPTPVPTPMPVVRRRRWPYAAAGALALTVTVIVAGSLAGGGDGGGQDVSSTAPGSTPSATPSTAQTTTPSPAPTTLTSSYRADAPWRIVIRNTVEKADHGCVVTLRDVDADGKEIGNATDLYGMWTFQISTSGNFQWEVNDPGCLVMAIAGTGAVTLPFTQPANEGDTAAFAAPARVAVEVVDFNGTGDCSPTLHDATNGEELDTRAVRHGDGAGPVVLDPKGRTQVYLNDKSDHACAMRVSAASG